MIREESSRSRAGAGARGVQTNKRLERSEEQRQLGAVGLGDWLGAGARRPQAGSKVRLGLGLGQQDPEPGTDEEAQGTSVPG